MRVRSRSMCEPYEAAAEDPPALRVRSRTEDPPAHRVPVIDTCIPGESSAVCRWDWVGYRSGLMPVPRCRRRPKPAATVPA